MQRWFVGDAEPPRHQLANVVTKVADAAADEAVSQIMTGGASPVLEGVVLRTGGV